MNTFQKRIAKYAKDRYWGQCHNPKDLLLGIVEEVGEIRNVVKWEQDPKVLHEVMLKNKVEMENNIGDIYWFLALLANSCDVDMDKAIEDVIKQNQIRFPVKDTRSKHTNRYLGGKDKQYDK